MPRVSLCQIERFNPLKWIDFVDRTHVSVLEFEEYFNSLSAFDQDELQGRIDTLKKRASLGKMPRDSSQLQDIRLYPELFELKWSYFGKGKKKALIRQYHAEPAVDPPVLVALHIHLKNVNVPKGQVSQLQDEEISHAKLRYLAGRKRNWVL